MLCDSFVNGAAFVCCQINLLLEGKFYCQSMKGPVSVFVLFLNRYLNTYEGIQKNTSNVLVHCDCLVKFALPQKTLMINFYMGTRKLFYNPIILGQKESPDLLTCTSTCIFCAAAVMRLL
jgi:hypothetical protein